jgi:hypothetical protein
VLGVAVLTVVATEGRAGRHGGRGGVRHHRGHAWHPVAAYPAPVFVQPAVDPAVAAEPEEAVQTRRYLKVKNATAEKLTVFLRYCTQNTADEWKWYPASGDAVSFELDPGEESYLEHEGWTVNASRVRIWGETASGVLMDEYQDEDLWLVPETDGEGYHNYSAPEMEDFTFTFSGAEQ